MSQDPDIPLLDHELASDELDWMRSLHQQFQAARDAAGAHADPKEILREVLGREAFRLPTPIDLTGAGPWRGGRNRHGRTIAAVFLPKVELHRHSRSRTDQFPIYVKGEADGFSIDPDGTPRLTPVVGGGHFHNAPNEPHAFVPKVGKPVPADWEIVFMAITPRNLRDDTQAVSDAVRAKYRQVVGTDAPIGV